MTLPTLQFDTTVFHVIDRDGQPWLRGADIARALGYSRADKVSNLYTRNADEFGADMTAVVTLPDLQPQNGGAGQMRENRIFSLRGAYLLGMFASTALAKRFRRWVLDVLEGKAQPSAAAAAAPRQSDLFDAAPFDELALLRELSAVKSRLVELLEERLKGRRRTAPKPLTVDEVKLARELKSRGVRQSAIARHMGRSPATISLILRELH